MSTNLIVIIILIAIAFADFLLYSFSKRLRKFSIHFARIVLGLVFIFSGFVKAVDPLGSMYKFDDYFMAFGMDWLMPASLIMGFFLFCSEFIIGFCFLFNVKMKFFSWIMILYMTFFTILTIILAVKNPVSDCGCFGDAIILTNWETFYKNVGLLIFALIVFWGRNIIKNRFPNVTQYGIMFIGFAIILWISVYCYRHLPLMDFMPWKVGNRISEKVVDTPEIADINLVYKHKETGEIKKWTSKTLPYKDTAYFKQFEFVDQEKTVIQEFKPAPIHDFMVDDVNKVNHNADIIGNPNYQFLLISHDLSKAEKSVFPVLNVFFEQCTKDSIAFAALCGSDFETIKNFRNEIKAAYEFYTVDETALKSVVRSNPGLVLLKNGLVLEKWAWRDIPNFKEFKDQLPGYEKLIEKSAAGKTGK
ncbi:MAG TPA: DoxX family protein [Bacteroidales bacterium]|nr:DoxX family protein [Bacteroidales bacterium]HPI30601.1 DoxX family protein [Bacteroidales bacterium]HQN15743.1 DoxX family protein [Bacteroidales bacterium]HQP15621.1 DoxX family protein [Bacteroidales bacterium]